MNRLEVGRVISFDSAKGKRFGYLQLENGEKMWFHEGDHTALVTVDKGRHRFVKRVVCPKPIRQGDEIWFVRGFGSSGKERARCWCYRKRSRHTDCRTRQKPTVH
ncbi:MAG: hypothetical protein PHT88_00215 [Candidatus Moranbacteria bacterium]|nr:hypothetical protein [Candidatus Moranbacteria bacterium]